MFDFLNNVDYDTVFSGLSVVIGGIAVFMLKVISKKTSNTIDDKIVAALEEWYKKQKEDTKKKK